MTEWLRVFAALAEEPEDHNSGFPGNVCMVQIHAEKKKPHIPTK